MNKATVNIQGLAFTLKGEESEEHLNRIGKTVDELISSLMQANSKLNISTAAILTSCNLVDTRFSLEEQLEQQAGMESRFEEERKTLQKKIDALTSTIEEKDRTIVTLGSKETTDLKEKDAEIARLGSELQLLKDSVKEYRDDNEELSKVNKELKFELQSYKYKVLDLQNKLFENQMTVTRDKKEATGKTES